MQIPLVASNYFLKAVLEIKEYIFERCYICGNEFLFALPYCQRKNNIDYLETINECLKDEFINMELSGKT